MVHCSLAPPSFSWFQGGQGWKVAACGDWAQAGMHVRSCYQLRYASPEVRALHPPQSATELCLMKLHSMSKDSVCHIHGRMTLTTAALIAKSARDS